MNFFKQLEFPRSLKVSMRKTVAWMHKCSQTNEIQNKILNNEVNSDTRVPAGSDSVTDIISS